LNLRNYSFETEFETQNDIFAIQFELPFTKHNATQAQCCVELSSCVAGKIRETGEKNYKGLLKRNLHFHEIENVNF